MEYGLLCWLFVIYSKHSHINRPWNNGMYKSRSIPGTQASIMHSLKTVKQPTQAWNNLAKCNQLFHLPCLTYHEIIMNIRSYALFVISDTNTPFTPIPPTQKRKLILYPGDDVEHIQNLSDCSLWHFGLVQKNSIKIHFYVFAYCC